MIIPGEIFKITIVLILVFSFVFFPLYAARASDWWFYLKEYILDLISRLISRVLLSIMSNGITRVILTSGRPALPGVAPGPALVRDWGDFLQTAQHRGEDILRATVANVTQGSDATACPYLRNDLATSFGAQNRLIPGFNPSNYRLDSLEPFKLLTKCTLSPGVNVGAFKNNFSQGGWTAWNQLIQPQNNFFGTYVLGLDELTKQRAFQQSSDLNEATAGSGYTSKRTGCTIRQTGGNEQCLVYGQIITPGDLFGKTGAQTIDQELGWLVSSDELTEAVVVLTGIVTDKLTNFVVNSLFEEVGPALGADRPTSGQINQVTQACVNTCTNNCPAPLPQCPIDPVTGQPTNANGACAPLDPDPRNACVANCQSQCTNLPSR